MLAATGMRSIEVSRLTIDAVRNMTDDYNVVVQRKGGKYAKIAIAKFAIPYIKAYEAIRPDVDSDAFFITERTRKGMTTTNIRDSIRPIQQMVGVRTGTHNFRRTVITNIARVNETGVAAMIAGHSTSRVTEQHYILPSDKDRADVVNALPWNDIDAPEEVTESADDFDFDLNTCEFSGDDKNDIEAADETSENMDDADWWGSLDFGKDFDFEAAGFGVDDFNIDDDKF